MSNQNRILSIDIMRGFTLVLMLFVNDLYMPGVPAWLGHSKANFDGLGLPVLFYKNSDIPLFVIAGSVVWAIIMGVFLPYLLKQLKFTLKL